MGALPVNVKLLKILCPIDFSLTAAYATRYAITLAETHDSTLLLLQVMPPSAVALPDFYGIPGAELEFDGVAFNESPADEPAEPDGPGGRDSRLEKLTENLARLHTCPVEAHKRTGKPFLEIIKLARQENVDMIVIGTHGRTALPHVHIGSTAEKVVRMAPCPVLTVRHPKHTFRMP